MDRLELMYEMQKELQARFNDGRTIAEFGEEEHIAELMPNAFSMMAELFEAFKEVGWKPWATSRHFNRPAFKSEMIDAFHFFMNMMLHADMTPDELYAGYVQKNQENHHRIDEGYDGVSGKCPVCKRDFKDSGVECSPGVHVISIEGSQTEIAIDVEPLRVPRRNRHARRPLSQNDARKNGS